MKIAHLTLKKKWFDMIKSGEKLEEYREIKQYWTKRLIGKGVTHIQFKNGYAKDAPVIIKEVESIRIRSGRPEWGAIKDKPCYVIIFKKEER